MLLADDLVGKGDDVDHPRVFHRRGKGQWILPVQPDAIADYRGKLPLFGKAFPHDHVIEADHAAFDVGDVSAEHVGGFDNAAEALGQDRVQRHFTQIVKQSADKRASPD